MRDTGAVDLLLLAPLCWDEIAGPSGVRTRAGGAGFYAAHALDREGASVELHTPLADADRHMLELLPPSVRVVVHPSRATTRFRIELDPARPNARRLLLRSRSDPLDPDRVASSPVRGTVLLGPLLPEDLPPDVTRFLAGRGGVVDLGVQGLVRAVAEDGSITSGPPAAITLPPLRILSGDEAELRALTGREDLGGAIASIVETHALEAIGTRGDRGASIGLRGAPDSVEVPAIAPGGPIRHSVGLGDTFLAVYGWERTRGASPPAAGRRAAEAATRLLEEGIG